MTIPGMPTVAALSPGSYGLGWFIHTYRGHYRVQHGGNIDGFSALVTLFPRDELGVVVLTNRSGAVLRDGLPYDIIDRLLGLSPSNLPAREAELDEPLARVATGLGEVTRLRMV